MLVRASNNKRYWWEWWDYFCFWALWPLDPEQDHEDGDTEIPSNPRCTQGELQVGWYQWTAGGSCWW